MGEQGQLLGHEVGQDHARRAACERGQRRHRADGAGADDHRHVARLQRRLLRGLQADGQRLDDGAFAEAHVVGQAEGEGRRVHHVGREAAVDRRRGPEAHRRVEVVEAFAHGARVHVGNAGLHADAVAGLQVGDFGAHLGHHARGLVAEDHGRVDDVRADAAVLVVMNIAAAHAHGVHADLHVARADVQRQLDIAQRDLVRLFQNQCFH
ncbi:hypothetical protein D9M68_722050 [compost metagenome]